ncbi:hypothetical protein GXB81_02380 [Paraburkholderia sp. Ac-20336]|uniref:DUF6891 domain-containing protein n=1 Tax=Paraburkholderia sp. Ac-20336 TaxID=2703886 RepID=UPI00197D90CC|nr:hypothetical protein [Paraburkholderia sp. Ac-20336]MBN3801907.1 hypothetical protein [Paraburkholderia sp. Ac-20336]
MPLSLNTQDTHWRIHELVWGGFHALDDIEAIITDEYLDPDDLNADDLVWVKSEVAQATAAKRAMEAEWSNPTEYDRLEKVFQALRVEHFIALHCAGNTNQEGKDDAREAWKAAGGPGSGLLGYCFYHSQDVDRVVDTGHLYLSFSGVGPTPQARDEHTLLLSRRLIELLREAGFATHWSGSIEERIDIDLGQWRKRSPQ